MNIDRYESHVTPVKATLIEIYEGESYGHRLFKRLIYIEVL